MNATATATTAAPTTREEALRNWAINLHERATKAHKRHVNWLNAVDAYLAGTAEYPSLRRNPSKQAKHEMYGNARQLARQLGLNDQLRNLNDIADLLDAAAAQLGLRVKPAGRRPE